MLPTRQKPHLVAENPRVSSGVDTVLGVSDGSAVRVALADVSAVEVRKTDALLTAGLVLGIMLVVVGAAFGYCAAADCSETN
jgi:hypothetical protein